jgi:hypothetical protein
MSRNVTPGFRLPDMDPELADGGDDADAAPEPAEDVVPGLRPEPEARTMPDDAGTSGSGSENQNGGRPAGSRTGSQNRPASPGTASPQRASVRESAWLALLIWVKRTAADHKRHRSFGHWVWHNIVGVPPETIEEFAGYVRSRQWLKDYMTGWLRTAAIWEYHLFALLIGGPLKAAGSNLSRIGERQSRFWLTLAVALLALAIWLLRH